MIYEKITPLYKLIKVQVFPPSGLNEEPTPVEKTISDMALSMGKILGK